ncbi:MAG TPA: glycosyltransferase family 4 protein [Polyangiales bacterium]|nr:glycosyltransferase family 4 protein [Polyangiales bacterium]
MNQDENPGAVHRVALLGNHLPRQCGIATFTTDLADAISGTFPEIECAVVAMNDAGKRHAYGDRVRFAIAESDLASYRRATDFLNVAGFDVLCLQHEYGIFGGKAGSHVLALLSEARMPIVTTLHTILSEPTVEQRRVMDEISRMSSRLIVMSHFGGELLREVHGVPAEKIDLIPHGIPTLPSSRLSKRRLGVEGMPLILTFGLLSPDKGIEYVIDALPAVVARHPTATYLVVGATHPHVKEWHGEAYRRSLELRALKLGVEAHVVFHDRFVSASELAEFLAAADIYITPYLNPEQITSGTLAYAVGTGKAVISTPYRYARELLADGRGILVPWRDAASISEALENLLDDPAGLCALSVRAAEYGRNMVWPSVARQYVTSFERAYQESATLRRSFFVARSVTRRPVDLPELNLHHLCALTDDTGILQHALFSVPRYEDGYCLDDNARALLLTTLIEDAGTDDRPTTRALSSRYLAFVSHAFNQDSHRFRNFMAYSRQWVEEHGSEDSQGRALWALGAVVGRLQEPGRKSLGRELFHTALPTISELQSSRACAFALLGIHEYLGAFQGERGVELLQKQLSERLSSRFQTNGSDDWPWCEDVIAYDNARLPQALIVSGNQLGDREMVAAGLTSLRWLNELQRSDEGYFAPVGSNGFYRRRAERARFDQQPLEACATVSACLDAWRVTGDKELPREMCRAFNWFLGENQLQTPLYDSTTGGCLDGLHPDRPNENQGAESTLSFLLALTDMGALDSEKQLRDQDARFLPTGEGSA